MKDRHKGVPIGAIVSPEDVDLDSPHACLDALVEEFAVIKKMKADGASQEKMEEQCAVIAELADCIRGTFQGDTGVENGSDYTFLGGINDR
jgi:hypothetical protein